MAQSAHPVRSLFLYLFSRRRGPTHGLLARWLFLRALGLIYFSAFFALLFQIHGLIGPNGVLPADRFFRRAHALGPSGYWYAPSLLWLGSGDRALSALVWTGLLASILLTLNILPRLALGVCFACFLSFIAAAQDFSSYQSDGMLLEAGFLSFFLAPRGLLPGLGRRSLPVRAAVWLLLWEWFRIYFESGVVKLASGDPTWRNFTALYEYYQNGPLPTWVGWYLQHLPNWFHKLTAALTLFMELALVWLVLIPRPRWRFALFVVVTVWQAGVIATANYAFLNYLVLALGFLLLDDRTFTRLLPSRITTRFLPNHADHSSFVIPEGTPRFDRSSTELSAYLAAIPATLLLSWIAYATTVPLLRMFWNDIPLPTSPIAALEPSRIAGTYGLFAVMTPHRYEIEFQRSDDLRTWTPYPFRYKPQDPAVRPRIYAPYQPRFDWNLWFASLEPFENSPIVFFTERQLLANSSATLGLFAPGAQPGHAPRFVRAVLYQYWFSSPEQKRSTGIWWRRQLLGTFSPTITRLPDGTLAAIAEPDLHGPPPD